MANSELLRRFRDRARKSFGWSVAAPFIALGLSGFKQTRSHAPSHSSDHLFQTTRKGKIHPAQFLGWPGENFRGSCVSSRWLHPRTIRGNGSVRHAVSWTQGSLPASRREASVNHRTPCCTMSATHSRSTDTASSGKPGQIIERTQKTSARHTSRKNGVSMLYVSHAAPALRAKRIEQAGR